MAAVPASGEEGGGGGGRRLRWRATTADELTPAAGTVTTAAGDNSPPLVGLGAAAHLLPRGQNSYPMMVMVLPAPWHSMLMVAPAEKTIPVWRPKCLLTSPFAGSSMPKVTLYSLPS